MARRISPSQFRSKIRQIQQKQKRAVDDHNRAARKHNQNVKQAVSKINQEINRHNTAVRSHNSRVRANRARLRSELGRLNSHTQSPRFVEYRATVNSLQSSYQRLESHADASGLGGSYNELLDLSEQEAANNASVMNALAGDAESDPPQDLEAQQWLIEFLATVSADLVDRWRGALFSLNPSNPDAARHFCTSAREVITQILEIKAPDADVFAAMPNCQTTQRGNPTRRSKIGYFLQQKGIADDYLEDFVERDVDAVVKLFDVFNSGTHGEAGAFGHPQLLAIRKRVEDGLLFLSKIIS